MPNEENSKKSKRKHFPKWVIAVVSSVIAGLVVMLSGFALNRSFSVTERLTRMETELTAIRTDKERDNKQDSTLEKFWKIHSWTNKEEIVDWPDLSERK